METGVSMEQSFTAEAVPQVKLQERKSFHVPRDELGSRLGSPLWASL